MDTRYTGGKIAELRKEKGLTQKDIAEKLHVSVSAVSKWERGLNFPDLSLMEPLAQILGITVSELLGLENEPTEQIIRDITEISVNEKAASEKSFRKNLCVAAVTAAVFIAASLIVYIFVTNNDIMRTMFELGGTGFFNLSALILGLTAWGLAIAGIFCRKKEHRRKYCSLASFICCAAALFIPTLVTYLIMRFEYSATVEDTIGAYCFAAAILLIGTVSFNICSVIIHRKKSQITQTC